MTNTNDIPNEQILKDIKNTRKEIQAYTYLRNGYGILCELPETSMNDKKMFSYKESNYRSQIVDCEYFLTKLLDLADERGIGE